MSDHPIDHTRIASYAKALPRQNFIEICEAALTGQSYRFARQALMNWLVVFPGDLEAALLLARALHAEGRTNQALNVLEKLQKLDPEYCAAWEIRAKILRSAGQDVPEAVSGAIYALGGATSSEELIPEWSLLLRAARQTLQDSMIEQTTSVINELVTKFPDNLLVASAHLQLAAKSFPAAGYLQLAQEYYSRWPENLQFGLHLAEAQILLGSQKDAVSLLHQCATGDVTGQSARRLWGENHPYRRIWPDSLEIPFDIPIPIEVAAQLGWNLLPMGDLPIIPEETSTIPSVDVISPAKNPEPVAEESFMVSHASSSPAESTSNAQSTSQPPRPAGPRHKNETVQSVEAAFNRLSTKLKQPPTSRVDGRFPTYVILSTHAGLLKQYGAEGASQVETEMNRLAAAIQRRRNWDALVLLPDVPASAEQQGLKASDGADPWKIKLSLADLDRGLEHRGSMIGALLIVGGPQVVPFHHLPNPTDDLDMDVLSDNPYATLDANYFIPEWPVGRLPGESGADPTILVEQLRRATRFHERSSGKHSWKGLVLPLRWLEWLRRLLRIGFDNPKNGSLGYTAAVWEKSSLEVYHAAGGLDPINVSPPDDYATMPPKKITKARLGYYNLHGMKETADWYGQRDPVTSLAGPDYPVALTPNNVVKNGSAPQAVFSEACYGAYMVDKTAKDALSLKFIEIGTSVMIGSTCIAYGSIDKPLIGADLLGSLFWKYLRDGSTAGDALRRAKIDLALEMNQRQGFLDGEDQKTLISFILLGDPLVILEGLQGKTPKAIRRLTSHPRIATVCEHATPGDVPQQVSLASLQEIKLKLAEFLPGLDTAEMHCSLQHANCEGKDHRCATSEITPKSRPRSAPGNIVVTFSKHIQANHFTHHHYARATVDKQGKVVKLVVSR